MILLSIIIPTLNRFSLLQKVLYSLECQKLPLEHFEVIIVNDGSTHPDYQRFSELHQDFPKLKLYLLSQNRSGVATARNLGIEQAQGEYIVFLGDDMITHPYLFKQYLTTHEKHPEDSVLGFADWDPNMPITDVMRFISPYGPQFDYHMEDHQNCGCWKFYTSNLSVPSCRLKKEKFSTEYLDCNFEDIDLGYRLEKRGMKLIYNPLAITYHHHYHDEQTFIRRQEMAGRNFNTFLRLNPELKKNYPIKEFLKKKRFFILKRLETKLKGLTNPYYYYTFELAFIKGYLDHFPDSF
jgi:glycosyltransferase involved in cell wall biosynthesis